MEVPAKDCPGVGTLMGPIEEALRDNFFPALFGGEDIKAKFRKFPGHSVKNCGLGIPEPQLSEEIAYNTSKEDSGKQLEFLLGGSTPNYVGHRSCIRQVILESRR